MKFRTSASFGKRQEFIAVAKLLHQGFDVYMTLVDDQQIDCVIRQESDKGPRYLDIQIKARSREAKHPATFAAFEIRKPRPNFWFIFYSEALEIYWVMPSQDVVRLANVNKGGPGGGGRNKGRYSIKLANQGKGGWRARPKYEEYVNAFGLLR